MPAMEQLSLEPAYAADGVKRQEKTALVVCTLSPGPKLASDGGKKGDSHDGLAWPWATEQVEIPSAVGEVE